MTAEWPSNGPFPFSLKSSLPTYPRTSTMGIPRFEGIRKISKILSHRELFDGLASSRDRYWPEEFRFESFQPSMLSSGTYLGS
jgi:hypothetical protein